MARGSGGQQDLPGIEMCQTVFKMSHQINVSDAKSRDNATTTALHLGINLYLTHHFFLMKYLILSTILQGGLLYFRVV